MNSQQKIIDLSELNSITHYYIGIAFSRLNFNAPLVKKQNKRATINRLTDIAFNAFIEREYSRLDTINDENRAVHYGKKIGSTIVVKGNKNMIYPRQGAQIKRALKKAVTDKLEA